jgi:hypothetical protein
VVKCAFDLLVTYWGRRLDRGPILIYEQSSVFGNSLAAGETTGELTRTRYGLMAAAYPRSVAPSDSGRTVRS